MLGHVELSLDPDLHRNTTQCQCKFSLKLSSPDWMTRLLLPILLDDDAAFVSSSLFEPSPESKSFLLREGPNGPIQQFLSIWIGLTTGGQSLHADEISNRQEEMSAASLTEGGMLFGPTLSQKPLFYSGSFDTVGTTLNLNSYANTLDNDDSAD